MATNNTQEELRRQAVENLAASRAEIVADIQQLRSKLSPKLVLRRLVDRHPGAVVCVAIAIGAASSMIILRNTRSLRLDGHPKPRIADQSGRSPANGSRILQSLLPALLKSTVAPSMYVFCHFKLT